MLPQREEEMDGRQELRSSTMNYEGSSSWWKNEGEWREMRIDGCILTFGLLPEVIVLA